MSYIDHITQGNETIDLYSKILANNIAEEFNKTKAYQAGQFVFYDTSLYKSRENQNAGNFVSSKWERVTVVDMVYAIARSLLN